MKKSLLYRQVLGIEAKAQPDPWEGIRPGYLLSVTHPISIRERLLYQSPEFLACLTAATMSPLLRERTNHFPSIPYGNRNCRISRDHL